jgi:hypothetical protein
VPAITIVRSIKLARSNRRAAIAFALAPFGFIVLAVAGIYVTPNPTPPKAERITQHPDIPRTGYPETPQTYFQRLSRWRF